mmetsp:Transcript_36072/g.57902  ORF Transcript_36072/g.57902 Transcript_36072/m.57902 type:complete len:249 (+) Transcript_36072:65-811(+)
MAHFSGLVATDQVASPFEYCDIVTTTTHKSLRGPRGAMIFSRKNVTVKGNTQLLDDAVNFAVFPSLQGGPHNNVIAALALQLKEVDSPVFKEYSHQVIRNAKVLADTLISKGYKLVTNGTDNHLILWDLRPHNITGSKMEALCEAVSITLNKNAVFGDTSALTPGGVRVGTPALTTRGFLENDFIKVGQLLDKACTLAQKIQRESGSKKLVTFKQQMQGHPEVQALKVEVESFASGFFFPGIDTSSYR